MVLDLGVSSMQLDEADRGFSFMREGPLDMRMAGEGESAADLVNGLDETEPRQSALRLWRGAQVAPHRPFDRRGPRGSSRSRPPAELARLIEKAIGRKPGDAHPATRSFQALRIAVNDEFGQLVEGLFASERLLPEGGRLAVVTFHSLEDRIVKRFFDPEKGGADAVAALAAVSAAEPLRWVEVAQGGASPPPPRSRATRAPARPMLRSARRSAAPAAAGSNLAGLGVPRFRGAA